mmetsp:Transcript_16748/g.23378  ORF Transcript_16748/g.23378 Transcript_16748/m.23378 type:complete len:134 (+) Transcript_16748:270-671(+)
MYIANFVYDDCGMYYVHQQSQEINSIVSPRTNIVETKFSMDESCLFVDPRNIYGIYFFFALIFFGRSSSLCVFRRNKRSARCVKFPPHFRPKRVNSDFRCPRPTASNSFAELYLSRSISPNTFCESLFSSFCP